MDDLVRRHCGKVADPAPLPENPVVAMAYVPFQQFDRTFAPERALEAGTLFPELDKPFYGKQVRLHE